MDLRTTGEVARLLKVPESRLRDLLRRCKIAEVGLKIGGRRMWTKDEIDAARAIVKANA